MDAGWMTCKYVLVIQMFWVLYSVCETWVDEILRRQSHVNQKSIDLSKFDYVFVDGGHSYQTVLNDLDTLYLSLKNKRKILFAKRGMFWNTIYNIQYTKCDIQYAT